MKKQIGSEKKIYSRNLLALAVFGLAGCLVLTSGMIVNNRKAAAEIQQTAIKPVKPYANAPASFADLVDSVRPSVVSIFVKGKKQEIKRRGNRFGQPKGQLPPGPEFDRFRDYFKRFGGGEPQKPMPKNAQGSGFIISEDGYVVTNHHVIKDGEEFKITLDNGEDLDARLIGSDESTDLALLKIKSNRKFKYVELANGMARVGEWVLAVGNPFGLGGTVTAGIVSAHGRSVGQSPYDYLQIDAAVNRGNSGGPAFNMHGQVVGVNTAIFSPSGGNVGIAFAIPSPVVHKIVADLKSVGSVKRGWLGIQIQDISEDIAQSLGLKTKEGALVTVLFEGGPASKSDLRQGDVIVSVNGASVKDVRDLRRRVGESNPDKAIDIIVMREGNEKHISVKLGTFPTNKRLAALQKKGPTFDPANSTLDDIGLSVVPAREVGKGDIGVVITEVNPDSDASIKGLKVGDIITEVNGKSVNSPFEVSEVLSKIKKENKRIALVRLKDARYYGLKLK